MKMHILLAVAWLMSFGLCYACLVVANLWPVGLIIFVAGIFATKAYRGDKIGLLWLVCYALLWPFFSPMLGIIRDRQ